MNLGLLEVGNDNKVLPANHSFVEMFYIQKKNC